MNIQYCDATKAAIRLTRNEVAFILASLRTSNLNSHTPQEVLKVHELDIQSYEQVFPTLIAQMGKLLTEMIDQTVDERDQRDLYWKPVDPPPPPPPFGEETDE